MSKVRSKGNTTTGNGTGVGGKASTSTSTTKSKFRPSSSTKAASTSQPRSQSTKPEQQKRVPLKENIDLDLDVDWQGDEEEFLKEVEREVTAGREKGKGKGKERSRSQLPHQSTPLTHQLHFLSLLSTHFHRQPLAVWSAQLTSLGYPQIDGGWEYLWEMRLGEVLVDEEFERLKGGAIGSTQGSKGSQSTTKTKEKKGKEKEKKKVQEIVISESEVELPLPIRSANPSSPHIIAESDSEIEIEIAAQPSIDEYGFDDFNPDELVALVPSPGDDSVLMPPPPPSKKEKGKKREREEEEAKKVVVRNGIVYSSSPGPSIYVVDPPPSHLTQPASSRKPLNRLRRGAKSNPNPIDLTSSPPKPPKQKTKRKKLKMSSKAGAQSRLFDYEAINSDASGREDSSESYDSVGTSDVDFVDDGGGEGEGDMQAFYRESLMSQSARHMGFRDEVVRPGAWRMREVGRGQGREQRREREEDQWSFGSFVVRDEEELEEEADDESE